MRQASSGLGVVASEASRERIDRSAVFHLFAIALGDPLFGDPLFGDLLLGDLLPGHSLQKSIDSAGLLL
jgi:hypothetical protein